MVSHYDGIGIKVNALSTSIATGRAQIEILTLDVLLFLGFLCHKFEDRKQSLLDTQNMCAISYDARNLPHFLTPPTNTNGYSSSTTTATSYTDTNWKCAPIPVDLQDFRIKITGPVDHKMVISVLNSGANVYMANFEDFFIPT